MCSNGLAVGRGERHKPSGCLDSEGKVGWAGTGPAPLETRAGAVTMLTFLLPSQLWDNSTSWMFSTKIIGSEMAYNIIS